MSEDQLPRLRTVHRALADPLRIRLFELLAVRPQSAKELAGHIGMRADRLYHHLAQLEEAKLIEVSEYRRLPGGKVERVYAPAAAEPAGDDATPADVARLFNAALETTRADINAATLAREAGQDRRMSLSRIGIRLSERHMAELKTAVGELLRIAQDHPDDDGVWSTVLWTVIDREDRRTATGGPSGEHDPPSARQLPGK